MRAWLWALRRPWSELLADRRDVVDLCRRLSWNGFHHLETVEGRELVVLTAPLGSARLAAKAVDLFHPEAARGRRGGLVPRRKASGDTARARLLGAAVHFSEAAVGGLLEAGAAALWTVALPARAGTWEVAFLAPTLPRDGDTPATFVERLVETLEEEVRRRPAYWPSGVEAWTLDAPW